MTVDEAIERLTDFKRLYGGDYNLTVVSDPDGEMELEIVDIRREICLYGVGRSAVLVPSEDLITKQYHLEVIEDLKEDYIENLKEDYTETKETNNASA